jgi:hypothetical protein
MPQPLFPEPDTAWCPGCSVIRSPPVLSCPLAPACPSFWPQTTAGDLSTSTHSHSTPRPKPPFCAPLRYIATSIHISSQTVLTVLHVSTLPLAEDTASRQPCRDRSTAPSPFQPGNRLSPTIRLISHLSILLPPCFRHETRHPDTSLARFPSHFLSRSQPARGSPLLPLPVERAAIELLA